MIDINQLDQFNDVEEVNPDAMSTDAIPPPPDGVHEFKLEVVKDGIGDPNKRVAFDDGSVGFFEITKGPQQGKRHLQIVVDFKIDEPGAKWDGQSVRKWVNTMVGRTETSEVDTLLKAITGQAGAGLSNGQKIQKLHELIVAGARIKAETEWTATKKTGEKNDKDKDVYKVFARGMNHPAFAVKEGGKVVGQAPITEDPADGSECSTRFEIARYLPKGA
jgi:hypothetical protein